MKEKFEKIKALFATITKMIGKFFETTLEDGTLLKWEGDWEGEITRRLALPQFVGRKAKIRFELGEKEITFTITDQGEGFDWRKFLDFDPERAFDPNGRGIAMARLTSFSSLAYEGSGNVVVAKVLLQPPVSGLA